MFKNILLGDLARLAAVLVIILASIGLTLWVLDLWLDWLIKTYR